MAAPPRGVTEAVISGWPGLRLTTDALSVTVLPGKGADIYELTDLATGVDPLFKAPWGLQPPGAPPREGSDGAAFLENYEGSWQELFPNTNDACRYGDAQVPFHGEVAALPWSVSVEADDGQEIAVRLSVDCRLLPLRLERLMRLRRGARELVLDERVTNLSREAGPVRLGASLRARPAAGRGRGRAARAGRHDHHAAAGLGGHRPPGPRPAQRLADGAGCARAAKPTCRACRGRRRAATTTST